jgi:phosphinothricin acetyltransferase
MNPADNGVVLRDAIASDLPAINDIFNHYVLTCTCAWQHEPDTMAQRQAWFAAHGVAHPVIVAERGGEVIGWGSLSPFHHRSGYRFTVEDSLYIRADSQGRGIGTMLLTVLLRRAKALGYHSVMALISADQGASLALHAKFDFEERGRLREAGFKFDQWLDVVYMQTML